jgi:hypothetical protein
MLFNWKKEDYHPSRFLITTQIVLLVLIIIGIVLLFTQNIWVPKLVDRILSLETSNIASLPTVSSTDTNPSVIPPSTRPGKVDTGVEGIVTIGPTCPVMHYPPDDTCADKPYQTALVIVGGAHGSTSKITVHTDAKGYFSQELAPGTYTISSQTGVVMPRLAPVTFVVTTHKLVSLNLQFDSGIR